MLAVNAIVVSVLATPTQSTRATAQVASPSAPVERDVQPDVVVTARREKAEPSVDAEFDEGDIAADGSDNIGQLLSSLQQFIDPSGEPPIVLINGKPAGFDASILAYPVEALSKVSVLTTAAGAKYGARSGTRVVNLVLKRKFASLEMDAGANAATSGGQSGGNFGLARNAINEDVRWTAHAQSNLQSNLLRSARRLPIQDGIHSELNHPVTIDGAGVASALRQVEQQAAPIDAANPGDFQTLQPSSGNVAVGINVARPVGGLTASISVDASRGGSRGLRGIPIATLSVVDTVEPGIPITASRPLRADDENRSLTAAATLSGMIRRVQTNLAVNVSTGEGWSLVETGADPAGLQRYVAALGSNFNPNATFDPSLLGRERTRTRSDNVLVRMNLQRPIARLPAGSVAWSLSATVGRVNGHFERDDGSSQVSTRSAYAQSGAQTSVSLPISTVGSAFASLGDLSIDLGLGRQTFTGGGAVANYDAGLTWIPIPLVQFRGSIGRAQDPPSLDQLQGPTVVVVDRIFDYAEQRFVDALRTAGGNPALGRGSQTNVSLSMLIRPGNRPDLAFNIGFRKFVAAGIPVAFPELTPAVEAAFPSRVTRDETGRLASVDARPINLDRQEDATLTSALTLRLGDAGNRAGGSRHTAAGDRVRIDLALTYQLRVRNVTIFSRGAPEIDRLRDSGTSRHQIDFRLGVGRRAYGGNITAGWRSTAYVAGSSGSFRLRPPRPIGVSLFANLDRLSPMLTTKPWARKAKVSLDVQNLLRSYRHVTLPDGNTPVGFSRDEVDPLGRTVRVSLRKQF